MSKVKLTIVLILVFAIGGLSGSLITGMQLRKKMELFRTGGPLPFKRFFMGKMSRNLGLTANQRTKIDAIVLQMQTEMNQLREEQQPKISAIISQYTAQIEKELGPLQKEKMHKMFSRAKHRRMGKRAHGGSRMMGRGKHFGKFRDAPYQIKELRRIYSAPELNETQRKMIDQILAETLKKISNQLNADGHMPHTETSDR